MKADAESAKAQAAAGAKLAKPALTAKTKSKKKGKLTAAWFKVAGADGYELKVGKKTYTVKGGAKVSKTVKAKKGKKVKVQVRAFKRQGDNTVYSVWSKAKKVKVKR